MRAKRFGWKSEKLRSATSFFDLSTGFTKGACWSAEESSSVEGFVTFKVLLFEALPGLLPKPP